MATKTLRGFSALICLCVVSLVPKWAEGQASLATLVGTLRDSSGASLPQASVTVTNVGTGISTSTKTNSTGDYVIPLLAAGEYSISAELVGFKRLTRTGVVLEVSQKARVDLNLEIGEITDTVNVEGEAPLLSTENSELGQVISNRTVTELPLNGREFLQLVQLAPGANAGPPGTPSGTSLRGGGQAHLQPGTASLNGANPESNGFLLDGVENTDHFQRIAAIRPSVDVIQEFKVQDKLASAEIGTTSSGVVSVITKSGTNQFRGTLWEFFRNDVLDARSFFDTKKPGLRRNQFGGVLGGPVVIPGIYDGKNKTFFTFNYEATRYRSATTAFGTVPTPAMKQGDFSAVVPSGQLFDPFTVDPATGQRAAFAGNRIPSNRINPTSLKLLEFFPDPNLPSSSSDPSRLVNNYTKSLRQGQNIDQYLAKVDHNFSTKDRLFSRFGAQIESAPVIGLLPLDEREMRAKAYNFVVSHTHVFSPSTISQLSFTVFRRNRGSYPESLSDPDFNERYGFESRQPGAPPIGIQGLSGIGTGDFTEIPVTSFNIASNISKIIGAHTIKFGFLTERIGFNLESKAVGGGSRSFNGNFTRQTGTPLNSLEGRAFADFLVGTASSIGGYNLDFTADRYRPRSAFYHGFFQDDWKVSQSLTLNLGLRYDLFLPQVLTNGLGPTFFDFGTGEIVYPEDSPIPSNCCAWKYRKQTGRRNTTPDYTDFGPRFGFAYRLGEKMVLRGGYGIYYDPGTFNATWKNAPPFFKTLDLRTSPDEVAPANFLLITKDIAPVDVPLTLPVSFNVFAEKPSTGLMQQWTVAFERQLNTRTVLGAAYVGWKNDHFWVDHPVNFAPPGPGNPQLRRPFPQYSSSLVLMDNASGNYHGLNVKLEQKLSSGLSYLAGYSWGHSMGNSLTENGTDAWTRLQREDNLRLERADMEFDVRQRLTLSAVYELPFGKSLEGAVRHVLSGWQLGGIYIAQGGWPFTVTAGFDNVNQGGRIGSYPNTDGTDWRLSGSQRTPDRMFNTAAFSRPAPFAYGNVGRNTLRTDGISNVDLSLAKNFMINETSRLQFRAEAFNLANHAQFGVPNSSQASPGFGQVRSTLNRGRQIQFALKYYF